MIDRTIGRRIALILAVINPVVFMQTSALAGPTESELSAVPGKAVVIAYRDKKLKGSAADYRTYINDVPITLLTNGTWDVVVVEPGTYDLWIEMYNPSGLISRAVNTFQWDAGRVYFVKEDSYFISDGLTYRASATLVDEHTAKKEINELQQADNLLVSTEQDRNSPSSFVIINRLPSTAN